jgi:hypothetical protein
MRMTREQAAVDDAFDFTSMVWRLTGPAPAPNADTVALFWAARNGVFADNFADYELQTGVAEKLGIGRPWLLALGADLAEALIGAKGNYRKAIAGLGQILRRLGKEARADEAHHRAACYYVCWVESIKNELRRRGDRRSTDGRHAEIFGVVVAALEYMRDRGVKPTAPELFAITERVALASETDTRTAIAIHCRHVPLEAWLRPRT